MADAEESPMIIDADALVTDDAPQVKSMCLFTVLDIINGIFFLENTKKNWIETLSNTLKCFNKESISESWIKLGHEIAA